jgi:hypothetical protein
VFQINLLTDGSKLAKWVATQDCSLVGLGGTDGYIVTDDAKMDYSDWESGLISAVDQLIVHFPPSISATIPECQNNQMGFNFPISKGKTLFVRSAGAAYLAHLYFEAI